MLPSINIHSSWSPFITNEIVNDLIVIEKEIGNNFTPTDIDKVLRFLTVDLDQMKVVWLGQDVYYQKGKATGRSFEVSDLNDWSEKFRQTSLKNIIRLINKEYSGITNYKDIKRFNEIKEDIRNGSFKIKQPKELFESLEKQGVLFLNTSFTCEVGVPNSHKNIWREFSKKVLNYISEHNPEIIWFLWGKEAISTKEDIPKGIFFESRHPMMCSEKYVDDFLKFNGFKATMDTINWLG